ncbi:MAG: thiamine diphosphokinase [Lachnospiraceae bacterium]|nr:thiamine diphosphokinase [Lachnospiraceae bacterium]
MPACLIISGGEFMPLPEETEYAFVIACDHGYDHAKKMGIVPNLLIGDMDSMKSVSVDPKIPVLRYPVKKDDSDTMLAIRYAIENGYDRIVLICALGGRLDHILANLQGMAYAIGKGCACEIIGEETVTVMKGPGRTERPRRDGYALSLFSLTDRVEHLTIKGALYPAEDICMTNTFPLGLSNGWVEDTIEIRLEQGILLIVESRKT